MNRLSEILERKEALLLRCEAQRQQLAIETARWRAGIERIDAFAHAVRRAIANPLVGVLFAALAARARRRKTARATDGWASRITRIWRGAKLLGTVAAAARFVPAFMSIVRSGSRRPDMSSHYGY